MIAAVDIGSNAMRAVVAYVDAEGVPQAVETQRAAVRLGQDVFQTGVISDATIQRTIEALGQFRELLERHHVSRWRAVGTSALRDARNSYEVISKINWATGLNLTAIGGDEEARLVFRAVADRESLKGKTALLIDIGGGSAEVSIAKDGQLVATESFRMGSVRLLQLFGGQANGSAESMTKLVRGYVEATRHRVREALGKNTFDLCLGVGGNIEAFGDLRESVLKKKNNQEVQPADLDELIQVLKKMTVEERIEKLGLRPDRADVVLPAAVVLKFLLEEAKARTLTIPRVGLKEGLLIEIAEDSLTPKRGLLREQVLGATRQLGQKFSFDERHAEAVAGFAMRLFDALAPIHELDGDSRLLLETAAWLHDIGQFIGMTDHHKHSAYILGQTPIIGLTPVQRKIVSNVVRYHHKSLPKLRHEPYAALSEPDRVRVQKLVAIQRLADSMDFEHDSGLSLDLLDLDLSGKKLTLKIGTQGDSALAKWAIQRHVGYLEEMFQVSVVVQNGHVS